MIIKVQRQIREAVQKNRAENEFDTHIPPPYPKSEKVKIGTQFMGLFFICFK